MKPIHVEDLDPSRVVPQKVAVDTETSGLYVDAGARISALSIAWFDLDGWWRKTYGEGQTMWPGGISTIREEVINPDTGETGWVVSVAYPVDQGVEGTGKSEDFGDMSLWVSTENLSMSEYARVVGFIEQVGRNGGHTYQNGKFDLAMFEAGVRRWPGYATIDLLPYFAWDTQNGSDFLWAKFGTSSLKPTAKRVYGESEGDEQQVIRSYLHKQKLPPGRWDLMPWDIIAKYADQDARLTLRLTAYQEYLVDDMEGSEDVQGWVDGKSGRLTPREAVERRLATTKMLRRVERRGLPFDVAGSLATADEVDSRMLRLKDAAPFNPITNDMAIHYWFGSGEKRGVTGLGLTPISTTEKGKPQVTKSVVRELANRGIPFAKEWAELSSLEGANSRWYRGWANRAGSDGRLRTSVRQNGTVSGRFSVENIQLQAIPHDYRLGSVFEGLTSPRTLIADGVPEGFQLWELDLAQAELRVAAYYAKCRSMLELIRAGEDLHGETAKQLFGVDPKSAEWGQWRNVAKRGNFSFIFGIGWFEFQKSIHEETGILFSNAEAKSIVKDWNALYPEYKRAINHHSQQVVKRIEKHGYGWISTFNGERRWFTMNDLEYTDWGKSVHKAFNQRVQPNLAQFGIDLWLQSEQYLMGQFGDDPLEGVGRFGMVLMIHDSQVLLLPEGSEPHVEHILGLGKDLWAEKFPGVPGELDAKRWGSD